MRIYLSSSWKMEHLVRRWAARLREAEYEVDCFCDDTTGDFVSHWPESENAKKLDALTFLDDPRVLRAFEETRKQIDRADAILLILPAGNSAHLEAGYAVGIGKKLIIWRQEFRESELDVMYDFADIITESVGEVLDYLNTCKYYFPLQPPDPARLRGIAEELRKLWKFTCEYPQRAELLINVSVELDHWADKINKGAQGG